MKYKVAAFVILGAIFTAGGLAATANKIEISKYGKVLRPAKLHGSNIQTGDAPELRVEMVQIKNSEDYLIRFTGVEDERDGTVGRYTRKSAGADAWYYSANGKNLLREEGADIKVFTLYSSGKEYKVVVDAADKLNPQDLVKNFK